MKTKFDFSEKWGKSLQNQTITHPIIGDRNLIFICTKSKKSMMPEHTLYAISADSGRTVWKHTFNNKFISGSCIYTSTKTKEQLCILTLTNNDYLAGSGEVVAFNPAGEIEWKVDTPDNLVSAPRISHNNLLLTDGGDSLTIIDLKNHTIKHRHEFEIKSSLAAVSVFNRTVYIPCKSAQLFAISTTTGKQAWVYPPQSESQKETNEWFDRTPISTRESVFSSSTKGRLICLESKSGNLMWSKSIEDGTALTQPSISKNALFLGGAHGVYAISKHNGIVLWHHKTSRPVSTLPQLMGDLIFVTCEDHFAYVLNSESGDVIAKFEMSRRIEIPVYISSDYIYLADRETNLKAFNFSPMMANISSEKNDRESMEKKAAKLNKAGKWLEAIKLYELLGDFSARALALEQYARYVSTTNAGAREKAIAWEKAGDAFKESGEPEKREQCKIEIARWGKRPLFDLELKENTLVLNSWSLLNYEIKNIGFGLARFVSVLVETDNTLFEWKANQTVTSHSLQVNRDFSGSFSVKPLNSGNGVPLELRIEYLDHNSKVQTRNQSFLIRVVHNQTQADDLKRKSKFDGRNIAKSPTELRQIMTDAFNREELDSIIYELNFNIDDFPGALNTATRAFIDTIIRYGKLDDLLDVIIRERDYLQQK